MRSLIARGACEDYIQANAVTANLRNRKPPSCSARLATDKSIYIEVDTSYRTRWAVDGDFNDDCGSFTLNVYADLPKTIGKAFDEQDTDGQVVVKSPWTNLGATVLKSAITSRFRSAIWSSSMKRFKAAQEAMRIVIRSYGVAIRSEGQTTLNSLLRPDQEGGLIVRNAAIVRLNRVKAIRASVQTTDGAAWRMSEDDLVRCGISSGSDVSILVVPEKSPDFQYKKVETVSPRCCFCFRLVKRQ